MRDGIVLIPSSYTQWIKIHGYKILSFFYIQWIKIHGYNMLSSLWDFGGGEFKIQNLDVGCFSASKICQKKVPEGR